MDIVGTDRGTVSTCHPINSSRSHRLAQLTEQCRRYSARNAGLHKHVATVTPSADIGRIDAQGPNKHHAQRGHSGRVGSFHTGLSFPYDWPSLRPGSVGGHVFGRGFPSTSQNDPMTWALVAPTGGGGSASLLRPISCDAMSDAGQSLYGMPWELRPASNVRPYGVVKRDS